MGGKGRGTLQQVTRSGVQREDVQEREVETSPVQTQSDFSLQLENAVNRNITVINSSICTCLTYILGN